MEHLKASALFLKVQTLQSQVPSSAVAEAAAPLELLLRLKKSSQDFGREIVKMVTYPLGDFLLSIPLVGRR
jgi:hypothetical protein